MFCFHFLFSDKFSLDYNLTSDLTRTDPLEGVEGVMMVATTVYLVGSLMTMLGAKTVYVMDAVPPLPPPVWKWSQNILRTYTVFLQNNKFLWFKTYNPVYGKLVLHPISTFLSKIPKQKTENPPNNNNTWTYIGVVRISPYSIVDTWNSSLFLIRIRFIVDWDPATLYRLQ